MHPDEPIAFRAMTLRLKLWMTAATALSIAAITFNALVLPQISPDLACAMEQVNGATTKAWHSDCQPNMKPAGLLKAR